MQMKDWIVQTKSLLIIEHLSHQADIFFKQELQDVRESCFFVSDTSFQKAQTLNPFYLTLRCKRQVCRIRLGKEKNFNYYFPLARIEVSDLGFSV